MHQQLPKEIDPFRYAQSGLKLAGELSVSNMPRLTSALQNDEGVVSIDMHFDVDETGTPYLRGIFTSSLTLVCERCTEAMLLSVTAECLLALIQNEHKVEGLAEQYEPWLIDSNEPVKLSSVVEDELILALPLVPRHDFDCLPAEAWQSGEEEVEEEDEKPTSPFAVLSALKSKD
ncbi:DNA-binding protein [Methylophaga sp. 42_8_T64]|nr:DNA-binding protein [Methylophaga sp. 42_8_T64]